MNWYSDLLKHILRGSHAAPRGLPVLEQFNVQLCVHKPLIRCHIRDLNYRFMFAEAMWIAHGRNDVEYLARFNPNMRQYSDDGVHLYGAYGPRFMAQWPEIKRQLMLNENRRVVANIFMPDDLTRRSKDIPCTISWQFQLRGNALHMTANMRSSDAWLGIPYDVFSFWHIGNCVAGELSEFCRMETLVLNLANCHLYAEHWQLAEQVSEVEYWSVPSVSGFAHEFNIADNKRDTLARFLERV